MYKYAKEDYTLRTMCKRGWKTVKKEFCDQNILIRRFIFIIYSTFITQKYLDALYMDMDTR